MHLQQFRPACLAAAFCSLSLCCTLSCSENAGQGPNEQGESVNPDGGPNQPGAGAGKPGVDNPGGSDPQANQDPSAEVFEKRSSELVRVTEPKVSAEAYQAFASGNLELSLEMLRALDPKGTSNKAVSALSLRNAFGMVHAMAKGKTQEEIAKALHLPEDPQQAQSAINATDLRLLANNRPKSENRAPVLFSTANRVFVNKGLQPGKAYLDLLAKNYGTGVMAADFERDSPAILKGINEWVSTQTHGRIPEIVGPNDIDHLTTWVLINALYFKAPWAFSAVKPEKGSFGLKDGSRIDAEYVRASRVNAGYGEADGVTWVHLPLRGQNLALTLIVPRKGEFDQLRTKLSAEMLQGWFKQEKRGMVNIRFPKFKVESKKMKLIPMLKSNGMKTVFSAPDFSGFAEGGESLDKITFVYQSVFVAADEKGVEGAAVTAAGSQKSSAKMDFEFAVDRPFIFLVQDRSLGVALFAGQVLNPSS